MRKLRWSAVVCLGCIVVAITMSAVPAHGWGRRTDLPLSCATGSTVIRRGDTGPVVAEWQVLVNRWLAADPGETFRLGEDGVFGPLTDAVTRSFEHAEGLPVDGIVGPLTRAAYLSSARLAPLRDDPAADRPVLARGDRGPAVADWQRRLNDWWSRKTGEGPELDVDGWFGDRTESATRAFQSAQEITADGLVGPETEAALLSAPLTANAAPAAPPLSIPSRLPPDANAPTDPNCSSVADELVIVRIGADVAVPSCARVSHHQFVRIVNDNTTAVTVVFAGIATVLPPGGSTTPPAPVGEYLADGAHQVHVSRFGGTGPQLWVGG